MAHRARSVAAVFVHSGTGFIFGVINGRDLYFSSITPLAFVVAALSSGTALAMMILYFTFKYDASARSTRASSCSSARSCWA